MTATIGTMEHFCTTVGKTPCGDIIERIGGINRVIKYTVIVDGEVIRGLDSREAAIEFARKKGYTVAA